MSTKKEGFIILERKNGSEKNAMDVNYIIQSVQEGHSAFIRTDGRIWHRIKKNMIHHEMKKAEKPDIFYQNQSVLVSIKKRIS